MSATNQIVDDEASKLEEQLVSHWRSLENVPSIIVFDLDYTLWPYYMDQHIKPPIEKRETKSGIEVVDKYGNGKKAYKDVTIILKTLREKCLDKNGHLAIASKSTTRDRAMKGIDFYGWTQYLSSFQIYSTCKTNHMTEIKKELQFEDFSEVLFFDDCPANIRSTSSLGVTAILVSDVNGLDMKAMCKGLTKYDLNKKQIKPKKLKIPAIFSNVFK